MNVLYVVFKALLGGHVLSATTIAREMRQHDVTPFFAGGEGALADKISDQMPFESVEIPLFHGSRQTYFTWRSLSAVRRLRTIVREHHIDLIHAFDARSYMHAYLAGIQEHIPVLCTLCGGIDPYYNLPAASKIIVFSEEQKNKMVETFNWKHESVEVVRTRLDMQQITSSEYLLTDTDATQYGIDPVLPIIMMISSFDETKIDSIHQVLDAAEILLSRGVDFQLVLIGGQGDCHSDAVTRGQQICNNNHKNKIVFTGPIINAFRLMQRANIVLGVGRSAFEGMIYGRPTLVVGENGYAGTVSPETVEQIGWYNFSGRNQKEIVAAEILADAIEELLHNKDKSEQLGRFCHDFIKNEIDVKIGSKKIKNIYDELLDPQKQPGTFQRQVSFSRCLFPIMFDNETHTIKQGIKALLRLERS